MFVFALDIYLSSQDKLGNKTWHRQTDININDSDVLQATQNPTKSELARAN